MASLKERPETCPSGNQAYSEIEKEIDPVYEAALKKRGVEHLTPLLDVDNEQEFLTAVRNWAILKISTSPQEPLPEEAQKYQVNLYTIPPKSLYGLYGRYGFHFVETGLTLKPTVLRLTPIGIQLHRLLKRKPELSLFLIDGSAMEASESKPKWKRRPPPLYDSYIPRLARLGATTSHSAGAPRPPDIDILLLSSNPHSSLKEVYQELAREELGRQQSVRVYVRQSSRRSGFKRIAISTLSQQTVKGRTPAERAHQRKKEVVHFAQLAFPENLTGEYSPENRLLHHLFSRGSLPPLILLIPVGEEKRKKYGFFGVAIDFLSERDQFPQFNLGYKELSAMVYNWPEITFPMEFCPEEGWDHFLHMIRTLPWANLLPLIPESFRSAKIPVNLSKKRRRELLIEMAQRSSRWFAENIVFPIAENPSLLGDTKKQKDNAKVLVETLQKAFGGDPYLTAIRCLSPEISYELNLDERISWGMGLFDSERGLFRELGQFLNREDALGRKGWLAFLEKMKASPEGTPRRVGWEDFLKFLFERTGDNPDEVARLLKPSLYPGSYQEFCKKYLRLIDKRFQPKEARGKSLKEPRKKLLKDFVLEILQQSPKALTTQEITEIVGEQRGRDVQSKTVGDVLKTLENHRKTVRVHMNINFGPRIRKRLDQIEKAKRKRSPQDFWTTLERHEELSEAGISEKEILGMIPALEAVFWIIFQSRETVTEKDLCQRTGLAETSIQEITELLTEANLIIAKKRSRKRHKRVRNYRVSPEFREELY